MTSPFGERWRRIERRYTYRIPTAIACTVALLIAVAAWAVVDEDRRATDVVAGDQATTTTTSAGQQRPGQAGGTQSTDPNDPYAPEQQAGGQQPGTQQATGQQQPGTAQPQPGAGGQAAAAGGGSACPEGLDKGDCTGVTDTAIRVGSHTPESECGTPLPDTSDENEAEAEDWVEYINKIEGGIHGRKIELHQADDGYCQEMAGQAARKLIDEARVFAVQGFLGVDQNRTVAEYANSRAVPYLAGGGPLEWATRWNVFHQNQSSYDVMYPSVLKFIIGAQGLNKPNAKIGMMYVDTPDVATPTKRSFDAVPDANVVKAIPLSQGIKQNFLEEIRQFQAAGVDVVYCNCHPLNMVSFVQQADAQQFKPQYTFVSQGYDLDIVLRLFPGDSTWAKNAKGISNFCHPSHPCAQPWAEKLKQVKPELEMSQVGLVGIHAIELWAEPMRRVGKDLSRTRYMEALRGLEGWTTGITAAIDLHPDRSTGLTGFAKYESPGAGSRSYKMVDVGGQTFRGEW